MDQDALIAIRKWYEDQLGPLKGSPGHSKVRLYIHQRINEINMILFSLDEQETLRSLDVLFLLEPISKDTSEVHRDSHEIYELTDEDKPDFIFNLCSRSKGIQDQARKVKKENRQTKNQNWRI